MSYNRTKSDWLYGMNPVFEALRAGRAMKALYIYSGRHRQVGQLRREAEERSVPVKVIHDASFFDSRFPKGHQGVAAEVARTPSISIEELLDIPSHRGEPPFFVILDGIEDPRNLGAIMRSAEAARAHGVVVQERRSAGLGPEAVKASAGAAEHISLCTVSNIKHAMEKMKGLDIKIIGAEAGHYPPPWEADLGGPAALVLGSEDRGMRKTVRERCDVLVSLPIRGRVNSLNASVAAGILIYEYLRQNPALR
jgi:23S rRNA (guanosine2251-2'-O)-methyltransferase